MTQALTRREQISELEKHVAKVFEYDYKLKVFKLRAMETIYRHSRNPLETPRELMVLYQLFLEAESSSGLRKIVKLSEKLSLAEKYPWIKPIIDETKKLAQELEDKELELEIRDLL
ncbi:hypothetical protein [Thermofilum sp.]|jgi:hypothetical protein|uniref:hypothetical protein n=1 Tax=Thermofilum sp. TaxID=1961369 RepID=UPI0031649B49